MFSANNIFEVFSYFIKHIMEKKTILITSPSLHPNENIGGISNLTRLLIQKNSEIKYLHFITGKQDKGSYNLKWLFKQLALPFRFFYFLFVNHEIQICHFNIPQENFGIVREGVLLIIAKLLSKKVIAHIRGGRYNNKKINSFFLRRFFYHSLKISDTIICLSEIEKSFLLNHYKFPFLKIKVLPNCVKIDRTELIKAYEGQLKLLFIGRIDQDKGFEEIINTLIALYNKIDYKFFLCGTGPYKEILLNRLNGEIISKYIDFGIVSGDEKERILKESHIFLLPSYYEGLPNSLLEAMSYGVVPICTPVGSIPSVVVNNETGFLVPVKDSNSITEIILRLNENRLYLSKLGSNGFNYIQENHSLTHYITSLNYIYNGL